MKELPPQPFTFGAYKAPADIDVGMVAFPLHGSEVVGADDAVGGDDGASCGDANVPGVVRDGAADAAQHLPCKAQHPHLTLGEKLAWGTAQHC